MSNLVRFIPEYQPQRVISALSEVMDWGSEFTSVKKYREALNTSGEDIKVVVLDTGANPDHPDLAPNFKEGVDFTGDNDPIDRQGHGCIQPNAHIYNSMFGLHTIEDFFNSVNGVTYLDGDTIIKDVRGQDINTFSFNSKNKIIEKKRINAVHKLKYNGEVYSIKTKNRKLVLTPWHPVYVVSSRRGTDFTIIKKRADELKIGDSILSSFSSEDDIRDDYINVELKKEWVCQYCGYRAKGYKRVQCRKCNRRNWQQGEETTYIDIDENFAFLLGLILSDGHVNTKAHRIEFCNKNIELVNIFKNLSFKVFNKECSKIIVDSNGCYRIFLYLSDACKLLNNMGINSNKSLELEIPEVISKSKKDVIFSFLAGYIEGDGNVSNNRHRIITGSKKFTIQIVSLLKTLGVKSSYSKNKSGFKKEGRQVGSSGYAIRLATPQILNDKIIIKKTNVIKNKRNISHVIEDIKVNNYDGYLYDLTIQDNNNYVANGMIVSNTHCAGIIGAADNDIGVIGIAPSCNLYTGKVLNNQGLCPPDYSWIIKGLEWAIDIDADVVNMSLGAPIVPPPKLHELIRKASSQGIVIVTASGNEQLHAVDFPGRYEETISVAAMDKNGTLARYSNVGPNLDLIAPGTDIYSTYLNNGYAKVSGTSMSAPFVSGLSALLLSYHRNGQVHNSPIYSYKEVIEHIKKFEKGKLIDFGGGKGIGILDFSQCNPDVVENCSIDAVAVDTAAVEASGLTDWVNWKSLTYRILSKILKKVFKVK